MITIRPATVIDLPALVRLHVVVQELHAQNVPAFIKMPSETSAVTELFLKLLADSSSCVYVAEDDGAVVGYFFAQEVNREEDWLRPPMRYFSLEHLAVDPGLRRKGIGHALIERFFTEAKSRVINRTQLTYWTFNEEAARFFRKHGFTPLHARAEAISS